MLLYAEPSSTSRRVGAVKIGGRFRKCKNTLISCGSETLRAFRTTLPSLQVEFVAPSSEAEMLNRTARFVHVCSERLR